MPSNMAYSGHAITRGIIQTIGFYLMVALGVIGTTANCGGSASANSSLKLTARVAPSSDVGTGTVAFVSSAARTLVVVNRLNGGDFGVRLYGPLPDSVQVLANPSRGGQYFLINSEEPARITGSQESTKGPPFFYTVRVTFKSGGQSVECFATASSNPSSEGILAECK